MYVPEITGKHSGTLAENLQPLDLTTNATITQWLKLPAEISRQYEISYVYKSSPSDNERTGTLTIFVDKDTNTVTLDDEFRYTGATPGNQPDPTFTAQLGLTGNNTAVLYYTHAIANETGTLNISIKSIH